MVGLEFVVRGHPGKSMIPIFGTPPEVGWVLHDAENDRSWLVTKLEPSRNEQGYQTDDTHWGVQLRGGGPNGIWSGTWNPDEKLTTLLAEGAVLRVTTLGESYFCQRFRDGNLNC